MNTSTGRWALLGGGAGLGAGLMYLLDPDAGRKRRAVARDKAALAYCAGSKALRRSDLAKRGRKVLRQSSDELAKRGRSLVADAAEALHVKGLAQPSLTDRVRSKLGLSSKRRSTASLIAGTAGGVLAVAGLVGMLRH